MSRVAAAWARIEAWMSSNAPQESSAPPASPAMLEELAGTIGHALPEQLAESLGIHQGTSLTILVKHAVGSWRLLSTSSIAEKWKALKTLYTELGSLDAPAIGPVSAVFWKASWIPFASDGSGNLLCLDLEPEPGGSVGQVVRYIRDPSPRVVVTQSLASLLEDFASGLERGDYVFEPFVGLVPREFE